jgi:hypothetical protein
MIDYSEFDRLSQTYVDAQGLIDYAGLKRDLPALKRFIDQLKAISPESHPEQFKNAGEQLRYWMTAYNAWILYIAASEYPNKNALWNFLGLFRNRSINLGGKSMGLADLEHKIIRKQYRDPRIHFYLNCGATGCPCLWQGAIGEDETWEVLEQSAKRFINDPTHVRYDADARTLHLSKIFDWFSGDFLGYLKEKRDISKPHVAQYISLYLEGPAADALSQTPVQDIRVKYFPYNKQLNER